MHRRPGVDSRSRGDWPSPCLLLIAAMLRLRAVDAPAPGADLDHLPQTRAHRLRPRPAGPLRGRRRRPTSPGARPTRSRASSCSAHVPQAQREPLLIHFRAALRGEQRSFEYRSPRTGPRLLGPGRARSPTTKGAVTGGLSVALDISDRSSASASPGRSAPAERRRGHRRDPRARPQRRPGRGPDRGLRGRPRGSPGRRSRRCSSPARDGDGADRRGLRRRRPATGSSCR